MMCSWIAVVRLVVIGSVLGLPFFAVFGVITLCSKFTSFAFSLQSSIGLNPVSKLIFNFSD